MNLIVAGFITLCWLTYVLYWFASSFSQKPASEKPNSVVNYIDKFFSLAVVVILVKPDWFGLSAVLVENCLASGMAGAMLCVLGLAICIWARRTLAGNWSFSLDFKQDHELVRSGPYQFVRHPIYTGLLSMFLGSALAVGKLGGFVAVAIFLVKCLFRIRREEKLMTKHFPDEYPEYKKSTNALVPFLW